MARIGVGGEWLRVGGRVSEQLGVLRVEMDLIALGVLLHAWWLKTKIDFNIRERNYYCSTFRLSFHYSKNPGVSTPIKQHPQQQDDLSQFPSPHEPKFPKKPDH